LNPVVAITVLLCAVIGGWLGWRRATRPIARRSLFDSARPTTGIARRGFDRERHRRNWKIVVAIIYALIGAVIGFFVLATLPAAVGAQTASPGDLRYCAAMSEMYKRYIGTSQYDRRPRNDVTGDEAVAQCEAGNPAAAIPLLEQKLRNNGFTLPPR
jgi:uncharacterized membrane protein YfcA